jgi:transcription-repair coupling factor (superfamily II helicase)
VQFLHDQAGDARIRDNRVVLRRDWSDARARLHGAFGIVRDLAVLAKPEPKLARKRSA